ncbi:IucA/IucC family protein [Actinomadura sp. HBU206391]|uniref:IucA/IucC family protein n=1 Tax=Actinomadura sp. HBU206391 TaxID=2731692 RepID=UPI00164F8263|nr:IucA/IucC family protein [Actinomadura sp. HBU206391]MBC6459787.1 IucA/IucC family protein [Actinomadura sp. HBU206391]
MLLTRPVLTADDATGIALLNCLVREVCVPEHQVRQAGRHLVLRLPRVDVVLRARLRRTPCGPTFPLAAPIEEQRGTEWLAVGWRRLADLAAGELELATGQANPEFAEQVAAGHTAMAALIEARERTRDHSGDHGVESDRFVESEQALVAGHRFHPAPKARQGAPADWLPYAPEARARFRLRWLAVRADLVAEEGDLGPLELLGPPAPRGYRTLPVHPWQFSLLAERPVLAAALAGGGVLDLGIVGPEAAPTSSVRTAYLPDADLFCKFSLDVRITNCVRKNAWYELTGAVALSRLLRPVFASLGAAFDGCALLTEPAYRTVTLADRRLHEGLGVIVRSGVRGHAGTPLLAAALADPYGNSPASLTRMLAGAPPEEALAWWDGYVRLVAPPVLHAFLAYGVVLEPHLQNVLVAVDAADRPVQAIFRDLEGTKLVATCDAHRDLAELPPRVRESLTYEAGHGWNRVVYCLIVNHLAELAAAIADLHPGAEPELWRLVHRRIERYARGHAEDIGPEGAARLRALLAGVPLPAKANLRTRWERTADRRASYVGVPSPFGAR